MAALTLRPSFGTSWPQREQYGAIRSLANCSRIVGSCASTVSSSAVIPYSPCRLGRADHGHNARLDCPGEGRPRVDDRSQIGVDRPGIWARCTGFCTAPVALFA